MEATYSKRVGRMTWRGEQPVAFKAGLAEFRFNYKKDPVGALSTLSSVYYSYASYRLRNDLHGSFLRKMLVKLHIVWLAFRAMVASDRMVRLAGGLEHLTVNQLDVRQSVLRRVHIWGAADKAIRMAFEKFNKNTDKVHTKALLLIGRAEIFAHVGDRRMFSFYETAENLIPEIGEDREYRQLARVCRHLEEHYLYTGHEYDAMEMRNKKEWATRKAEEKEALEN